MKNTNTILTDKVALKKKALQEAINKHQQVIDDFKTRMSALLSERAVAQEGKIDNEIQSKTAESIITRVNPLGEQLAFANNEMRLLNEMATRPNEVHGHVQLGSIVITDKGTFFVSASIEQFMVDGEKIFGLSTLAPLYERMKGKKKGESFTYKETTYTIKDLF